MQSEKHQRQPKQLYLASNGLPFWLGLPEDFSYFVWNLDTIVSRPVVTLATVVRACGIESIMLERLKFGPVQNYYDFPCFKFNPSMTNVRLIPKQNQQGYTLWNANEEFAPYHARMRFRRHHLPMPLKERKELTKLS